MEKRELEISWGTLWKVVATVVIIVFLYLAHEAMLMLLFALVISSALDGAVSWLENKRVPRVIGASLIFITVMLIIGFILYEVIPLIYMEIARLLESYQSSGNFLGDATSIIDKLNSGFLGNSGSQIIDTILKGTSPFLSAVGGLFGGIIFLVTVFISSFYLTLSRDGVERLLRAVFPAQAEDYIIKIYIRSKKRIGRWMQAQMILSLVVGLVVFVGLWLAGIEYSLLIGLLAGLFEIVPVVGPIFAGAVGVAVAFSHSLSLAILTFVFFVVVQQLENNILVPILMKRAVNIHPVIIIIALMAGFEVGGIAGVILAVPVTVVIQEIVEDKLRRNRIEGSSNK